MGKGGEWGWGSGGGGGALFAEALLLGFAGEGFDAAALGAAEAGGGLGLFCGLGGLLGRRGGLLVGRG